jgi:hypothetical protein
MKGSFSLVGIRKMLRRGKVDRQVTTAATVTDYKPIPELHLPTFNLFVSCHRRADLN